MQDEHNSAQDRVLEKSLPRRLQAAEGTVPPSEVYRFVGAYWIYQDQIGWSRIQTLVAVEAAILAGAFARQGLLSPLILFLGTVLIEWIFRLIQRDWQVRDHLGQWLDNVNREYELLLIPEPTKTVIRGRVAVKRIFWGLTAVNMILGVLRAYEALSMTHTISLSWFLS